jgi:hypothetical protein
MVKMIDYLQWLHFAVTDGIVGCKYSLRQWFYAVTSDSDNPEDRSVIQFWNGLDVYTWCDSSYKSWDYQ